MKCIRKVMNDEASGVIEELFESLKKDIKTYWRNQWNVVSLLCYKCHKINLNCGGSYVDFPDWIINKEATINPISKKDTKCFQYAVTVALKYEEIGIYSEIITKTKLFINRYNCKGINFPSEKDDWKKIRKNNVTIFLNILYAKKEKIYPAYVSKHNSNLEKQYILLVILNKEGWWNIISVIKRNNVKTPRWFFIVSIAFIPLQHKTSVNLIKKYVKMNNFA